jgi:predicted metal-dependent phosphoesterase TrpH
MPKRAPFTRLCGQLAELSAPARADLHVHTTASDGEYTPSQVVAQARLAGLRAVAITDHDTCAGVTEARAAAGEHIELVAGVEISTSFGGCEYHLLGYFVRLDLNELNTHLTDICAARRARFRDFIALLRAQGRALLEDRVHLVETGSASLGRRNVAGLLVACGHARTRAEAFHRFVNPLVGKVRAKALVPIEAAIRLVHEAGGVASLAHPPDTLTDEQFADLRTAGLDAVEVVYPWGRNSPVKRLREVAARFGFATSGGSDCHGPDPAHRHVGSQAITGAELTTLRERAGAHERTGCAGC